MAEPDHARKSASHVELRNLKTTPPEAQVAVSWKNLRFSVDTFETDSLTKQKRVIEKVLLDDVTGYVNPGQFLAVMGPSGCGKTTLLSHLAGRSLGGGHTQGSVMTNGQPANEGIFRKIGAFCPQEDVLYGVLTVRETLIYAAQLQLPRSTSHDKLIKRVDEVIDMMGLRICEHVKIGDVFYKGVSGGQKRRVSISQQLLKNPSVLFLDEPTSGLDSTAAFYLVKNLVELSRGGVSIMATIHQPASQVFEMFDLLLILTRGRTIYFGPGDDAVGYFDKIGLPVPLNYNPPDHFLSEANYDFYETEDERLTKEREIDDIVSKYLASPESKAAIAEVDRLTDKGGNVPQSRNDPPLFHEKLWVLIRRGFVNTVRNPAVFGVRLAMYIGLCLMLGLGYFDVGLNEDAIQDRISCLFYLVAFLCFMAVAVIPAFIEERSIFRQERLNGMYSPTAYTLMNVIVTMPGLFLIALVSSAIVYPMVNLHEGGDRFGVFLLTLFLSLLVAESIMCLISACLPIFMVAIAIAAALMGFFMLLCGFFLLPDNIPVYFIWGHYLAFHKYAFESFMYNDFSDLTFKDHPDHMSWPDDGMGNIHGEAVLARYEYEDVDVTLNLVVLLIMFVGYRICFFLALKYLHTGMQ